MSDSLDDLAEKAVAGALRQGHRAPAACAALVRLAGQALARLTSHDQACRLHAALARCHAERAARSWRA